ncbi:J domain-containing protein [Fimbriiglobus ruber]|nr:J domain-containing protein [Fimbriiglobus ruber]
MVQQAFTGFVALPSNSPWDVLGLKAGANRSEVEVAYREKAKSCHPDRPSGSHEQMARLNAARDVLLRRVG